MLRKEWKVLRSGSSVADWSECTRFMEGVYERVVQRHAFFLDQQPLFRGLCLFFEGPPPRIEIELWRIDAEVNGSRAVFRNGDASTLFSFMDSLTQMIRNITVVQTGNNPLRSVFEIRVYNHVPFVQEKQLELDLFVPF